MDHAWWCPICPLEWFAMVQDLAHHLVDWHDEWLTGGQLPPPRPRA